MKETEAINELPATFDGTHHYTADTCEPLKRAAAQGRVTLNAWTHSAYPGASLPPDTLPGLSSVGVWNAQSLQDWGLDWHCNEGIELTYVIGGKVPFATEADETMLRQGHMTITRPWQRHRVGNPSIPASSLVWFIIDVGVRRPNQEWIWPEWLVFSPGDRALLTTLLRQNENPVWDVSRAVRDRFHLLAEALHRTEADEVATRIAVCINDLLLEVMEHFDKRGLEQDADLCSSRRTVELFLAELQERFAESWTLEEMARACNLGRTQFSRYCKGVVNMTPLEYLATCRIEAAKHLLLSEPTQSVMEVAFACGFNSSQYFATLFQHYTGVAPTTYRRNSVRSGSQSQR